MATFVLIFNRILYESADSSGKSWVQEPFPTTGAPQGVIALGTGAVNQWVLDSTSPTAPL